MGLIPASCTTLFEYDFPVSFHSEDVQELRQLWQQNLIKKLGKDKDATLVALL
jgi:hypothetical protein